MRRTTTILIGSVLLAACGTPQALAMIDSDQAEVLWRAPIASPSALNRPAIGPTGEIAMQTSEVVVVEQDGSERWRQQIPVVSPDSICDFGPDGTLYVNSSDGIRAYSAAGVQKWLLPAPGIAHQSHAGPTVGPDGNIYFCDMILGGFGFASVTPGGDLRWNIDEFRDIDSAIPRVEVAFGSGVAYISSPGIPDPCDGDCLASGMLAVGLDGTEQWTTLTTAPTQPAVLPSGEVLLPVAPSGLLRVDGADGSTTPVPFSPLSHTGNAVTVAPDGTAFAVANFSRIMRIEPGGGATVLAQPGAVMGTPAVSPDGSLLVVGTADSLIASPNRITGIDTLSGETLWEIPLPMENGYQLTASGWPRFSDDGSSFYVGVNAGNSSYIYAVALGSDGSCPADLAELLGVLDLGDVQTFVTGFSAQDAIADFDGNGVFDLADVQAFVASFVAGCP